MPNPNNTTHPFFSASFPAERRAKEAAELLAATFAENPKLRGMTIVVTDEHDDIICKVACPRSISAEHRCPSQRS
jgi:hypothetical protein